MLLRVWIPFRKQPPGDVVHEIPLPPLQRIRVHQGSLLLLAAYLGIGQIEQLFLGRYYYLPGTEIIALVGVLIVLTLPMRYVLTDRGVAINNTAPRLWRQFRRYDVGARKIVLRPKRGFRSYTLYVSADAQAPVLRVLKRRLR